MGECLITRRGGERYKVPVLNDSFPQDVSVMQASNATATFSVVIEVAGNPEEYTYQWYKDNQPVSGASLSTYTATGLTAIGTYSIYCVVANKAGSVTSRVANLSVTSCVPEYTYNGTAHLSKDGMNWNIKLTTGGTFKFTKLGSAANGIEAFLCGGGGRGGAGYGWCSGGGGGGGYTTTKTINVEKDKAYSITIGGSGGSTSAFGLSASAGKAGGDSVNGGEWDYVAGGAGTGAGGRGGNGRESPGNGEKGKTAFNSGTGVLFGAGGGGGMAALGRGYGGETGGGNGSDDVSLQGNPGKANSGGGGGGSGNNWGGPGGNGGSGIVIIRNKRS